jgi:hypothetical protein
MVWARAESVGPLFVVCWGGVVSERKLYPSDLSDEQWLLIEPVITAWKGRHRSVSGHQGAYDMPEIVRVIHELLRCQVRERVRRSENPVPSSRQAAK